MNNDLISKGTLLEELKEKIYLEKFGERCNPLDVVYAVLQVIEEQPTAYDVDKVCRKINENKDIDNLIDVDYAIKMVKAGGID